jgi:NAD(P)H-flavin reductase
MNPPTGEAADRAACGTPPADPWQAFPVTIVRVTPETPGVATYDLELCDPAVASVYQCRPGQFNMLYLPGIGESAISISALPEGGRIPHTVRVAGNVTGALARLGEGGHLGLRGPFGRGWPLDECAGRDVVIVAGGIGLAPLRPVIHAVLAEPERYGRLTVLCGARSPEHLLYQHEHSRWLAGGAAVETTVDRWAPGWTGHVGVVPLLVDRMDLPDPRNSVLLVCGPDVMMWYTVQSALKRGLAPEQIWLTLERNMNCAIGLCGHCQFGPAFICKDGPVLRYDALAPLLRVKDL